MLNINFGFTELKVYKKAYALSMEIFELSKKFPKEEKYALTDQIRCSSRSVCSNIGEGYRKRIYPKHFTTKMTDADGECSETLVWISFSFDCGYLDLTVAERLCDEYLQVGKMLGSMANNPEKFLPKTKSNVN